MPRRSGRAIGAGRHSWHECWHECASGTLPTAVVSGSRKGVVQIRRRRCRREWRDTPSGAVRSRLEWGGSVVSSEILSAGERSISRILGHRHFTTHCLLASSGFITTPVPRRHWQKPTMTGASPPVRNREQRPAPTPRGQTPTGQYLQLAEGRNRVGILPGRQRRGKLVAGRHLAWVVVSGRDQTNHDRRPADPNFRDLAAE